jgi:hypothetical protein
MAVVKPYLGLPVGDCRQPVRARPEKLEIFKALRELEKKLHKPCSPRDLQSYLKGVRSRDSAKNVSCALQVLNSVNAKRIASGEKITATVSSTAPRIPKVPPPKLRANYQVRDILDVDVCTRTCIGEMGGQIPSKNNSNICRAKVDGNQFDPLYQTAVVANINNRMRKAFSTEVPPYEHSSDNGFATFGYKTSDNLLQDPMINVIMKPGQYTNWSTRSIASDKLNHSRSLCPPSPNPLRLHLLSKKGPPPGKFFAGGAVKIQPIQALDQSSFDNCATQCADAVFSPDDFWRRTNDFDAIFYASPPTFAATDQAPNFRSTKKGTHVPHCPATVTVKGHRQMDLSRCFFGRKRKVSPTTIGGQELTNLRCMTFYDESKDAKTYPWADQDGGKDGDTP